MKKLIYYLLLIMIQLSFIHLHHNISQLMHDPLSSISIITVISSCTEIQLIYPHNPICSKETEIFLSKRKKGCEAVGYFALLNECNQLVLV